MLNRPSFIGHLTQFLQKDDCHYPGSEELLSIGSTIGKSLGLKKIGIHVEILPPGRRTSWPHAESHEEEFVFVLSGFPHAWIDGETYPLVAGDFVAFPSGTGITHTFLNDSETNALLLVGGESKNPMNKLFYPLHPQRNEEIKPLGLFWEDLTKTKSSDSFNYSHDGKPTTKELKNKRVMTPQEIIQYLKMYYLTHEQFARLLQISEEKLQILVDLQVFPQPSHRQKSKHQFTSSVFGDCLLEEDINYYSCSYLTWWDELKNLSFEEITKKGAQLMKQKFFDEFEFHLKNIDGASDAFKGFNFPEKIEHEWASVMRGGLGVCLKEVCARSLVIKDTAIFYIENNKGENCQKFFESYLEVVTPFAPYEWEKSSRKRLQDLMANQKLYTKSV